MSKYHQALEAIVRDPRYLRNIKWGEPRPGHPEGSIEAHIAELESNLARLEPEVSEDESWKLKLLIHTHDLFKGESPDDVAIVDPRSHASHARRFLAEFIDDPDLLNMVQFHDEPYALHKKLEAKGYYNADRFNALLKRIQDWDVFLAFNIVDGCTSGKNRRHLYWLFKVLQGKVITRFTADDIIEDHS
jgi:hypothetical protein